MLLLAYPETCSSFGTDAIPNLDDIHLIENTARPILVRQLKEAHSVRKRIDEIIEDAQLLGEAYLDADETEKIKCWWQ